MSVAPKQTKVTEKDVKAAETKIKPPSKYSGHVHRKDICKECEWVYQAGDPSSNCPMSTCGAARYEVVDGETKACKSVIMWDIAKQLEQKLNWNA